MLQKYIFNIIMKGIYSTNSLCSTIQNMGRQYSDNKIQDNRVIGALPVRAYTTEIEKMPLT